MDDRNDMEQEKPEQEDRTAQVPEQETLGDEGVDTQEAIETDVDSPTKELTRPEMPVEAETPSGLPVPSPVPQKKKRKGILIGAIIAAALVILGGGAALAYTLWYQNPEKVVYDSIINAVKAKTVSGNGVFAVKNDDMEVTITFDGQSEAAKGLLNVQASIKSEDITLNAGGSGMMVDDTLYFKLTGLDEVVAQLEKTIGTAPAYVDDIVKKLNDTWISVKPSDYEDVSKELSTQQQCTTDTIDRLSTDDGMKNEVVDLYKEHKVLVVGDKIGSKDGSLGYTVELDPKAAVELVRGLGDTKFGKALSGCNDGIDFGEIADDMADSLDDADTTRDDNAATVEIWVSRFGHEITSVVIRGEEYDTTVNLTLNPVFNKDVTVEAPADATSLKDLIADLEEAYKSYAEESMPDSVQPLEDEATFSFN
jgi:hypothetical protein